MLFREKGKTKFGKKNLAKILVQSRAFSEFFYTHTNEKTLTQKILFGGGA